MRSWDYLGAIAMIEAAGGRVNEYLVGDALLEETASCAGIARSICATGVIPPLRRWCHPAGTVTHGSGQLVTFG